MSYYQPLFWDKSSDHPVCITGLADLFLSRGNFLSFLCFLFLCAFCDLSFLCLDLLWEYSHLSAVSLSFLCLLCLSVMTFVELLQLLSCGTLIVWTECGAGFDVVLSDSGGDLYTVFCWGDPFGCVSKLDEHFSSSEKKTIKKGTIWHHRVFYYTCETLSYRATLLIQSYQLLVPMILISKTDEVGMYKNTECNASRCDWADPNTDNLCHFNWRFFYDRRAHAIRNRKLLFYHPIDDVSPFTSLQIIFKITPYWALFSH